MTKQDIKDFLINEAELRSNRVNNMTNTQLLNHYLIENGIGGFTNDIIDAVQAIFNVTLND